MQAAETYAIYSPRISGGVTIIKSHVREARSQNGVGSFLNAYEKVTRDNKELKAKGEAYGIPGLFTMYMASIKNIIIDGLINFFYDDWSLLINRWYETNAWITNCMRDDIWELKALQEAVLNELLKAALLNDAPNSTALWEDYQKLENTIQALKEDYKETALWFDSGQQNYYVNCPYGEFKEAWEELENSWDRFTKSFASGSLQLGSFAEMGEVAKRRARIRATQWIAANQLKLTIGGTRGGRKQGLFSGPGVEGMAADFKTQWKIIEGYGDMIFINTWKGIKSTWADTEPIDRILGAYEEAQKAKEVAIDQMETALTFNLQLNNVEEQVLISLDAKLADINWQIQRGFKTYSNDDKTLKDVCEQVNIIIKKMCINKGNEPANCKQ